MYYTYIMQNNNYDILMTMILYVNELLQNKNQLIDN